MELLEASMRFVVVSRVFLKVTGTGIALCAALGAGAAFSATSATEQMAAYAAQSGQSAQAAPGQTFFTSKHGKDWSCSSCHTATPTSDGKHASTGKAIAPMAPAFNPERFADAAKTEKWFRRNCNDVVGRECTAGEKADVIAFLLSFKK
jgi:hypothetical protein